MTAPTTSSEKSKPLSRTELLGIFAFWTLLALLTAANRLADQRDLSFSAVPRGVPIALAFQQMYLWALLTPLVFWLAGWFNADRPPGHQGWSQLHRARTTWRCGGNHAVQLSFNVVSK